MEFFWSYKAETDLASLVASMSECGVPVEESLAIAQDGVEHAKQWEEKARQNREKIRTALPEAMEMIEALEKLGIPFRITKLEFHNDTK